MKWIASLVGMSAMLLASAGISQAGNCVPCGGCSDPCAGAPAGCGNVVVAGAGCASGGCFGAGAAGAMDGAIVNSNLGGVAEQLCKPIKGYKVVMEPKYVTESRPVTVWKTRNETRYRTKKVYKTVPVTETKYRSKTIMVPRTETKTVKYSQLVPVKSEKTIELTESVPVWSEVAEEYTVRVPELIEVADTYTVKVPQLQEETFTYTVNVPHTVSEKKIHLAVNAVPVTKTRTIQVCVPTTTMQSVTKDYGHWEEQLVEVPAGSAGAGASTISYGTRRVSTGRTGLLGRLFGGGGSTRYVSTCAPACSACGTSCGGSCGASAGGCGGAVAMGAGADAAGGAVCTTTKRVWVPNVVTENVPVISSTTKDQVVSYTVYEQQTTQIPYECVKLVYQPEQRTGTRKVCVYVDEQRSRTRKVVKYNNETRTRMRKQLTYATVTKTETFPFVTYKAEERTKEVSYTYNIPECSTEAYEVCRYDRVCEEQVEEYTACVPYCVMEERQVQVCKMVPRFIEEVLNVCCDGGPKASASGACAGAGCGCCK